MNHAVNALFYEFKWNGYWKWFINENVTRFDIPKLQKQMEWTECKPLCVWFEIWKMTEE